MSPFLILTCVGAYFGFLVLIAWYTSRNATNASYFLGNKASPWIAVAFGLIGDTLSGVTFISVPGQVGTQQFAYLQIVFGYVLGYLVIAQVLLPLYYRLNLTSIYSYLRQRYGPWAQKSGSLFFLLSRTTGAAARLYLAANVLQSFVFDQWNVPFGLTVSVIIALILVYTLKGGIRTLVWTDTFQSTFLLLGLVLSIGAIGRELHLGPAELAATVRDSPHAQIFFWDWHAPAYFWKQLASGACMAIVMTGLDQNMMQKNLSCRSLGDAQKNLYAFTIVMVFVNLLFVSLGALLYRCAEVKGLALPANTDLLFPTLAFHHLGMSAGIVFIVGLTAATFSSADSVLTTLTTSFCIDILELDEKPEVSEQARTRLRHRIHIGFAVLLWVVILGFKALNSSAVINAIFTLASYSYGPLLGMFAFGLFHHRRVRDPLVPLVCLASPFLSFLTNKYSQQWLWGYKFGFELLMLNGLLTYVGLALISQRREGQQRVVEQ